MSAVPAARYLRDFGVDGDIGSVPAGVAEAGRNASAAAATKVDEAFARGVQMARAAAEAELEVKMEEQRNLFAEQLAAERETWATGTGEGLANSLLTGLQELETRIAETAARILKPFVAGEVHRQAIAELQASLDVLVSTDSAVSLHISGPADILQVLEEQLAGKTLAVTYAPNDDCDVRIVAGQAMLETRLKAWMAQLEGAVP